MRKLLLSFMMTVTTCLTASATDFYLWVTQTSGDETSWAVSEVQKITFSGSNVIVTATDGTSATFAMSDVSKLNFQTSPTAINSLQVESPVRFVGDNLQVSASEGTAVDVYSATGALVGKAYVNGSGQVSLSNLPKGVYMVKVGGKTSKVLKR